MEIIFEKKIVDKIKADAFLFLCYEDKKLFDEELKLIEKLLKCKISKTGLEDFEGKEKQTVLIYTGENRIILSGLGLKKDLTLEKEKSYSTRSKENQITENQKNCDRNSSGSDFRRSSDRRYCQSGNYKFPARSVFI